MTQTNLPEADVLENARDPGPTSSELFQGFLVLGLTGFGGVLPLARSMIVDKNHWLRDDEFVEVLALCQFVPGGNIINIAVVLGLRYRGVPGAAAALIGLLAAPTAIAIALGSFYLKFGAEPLIRRAFAGLAAAAAGLLLSLAYKVARPLFADPLAIGFAAICFAAVAVFRMPLAVVIPCLTPICILVLDRAHR